MSVKTDLQFKGEGKMNRYIKFIVMSICILLAASGCKEDEIIPVLSGTGISEISWNGPVAADEEGEILSLTFTSEGKWTAESSDPSWCRLLTENGVAGPAALRIEVDVNVGIEPRTTSVEIAVEGYPESLVLEIVQSEGVTEKGDGRYREVNEWVYRRMSENYLWNEPIPGLPLDYSLDYQAFLKSILDGVAKSGDVNHDDGAYNQELRTEYYSQIISMAPITRTTGQNERGNGFYRLRPVDLGKALGVVVDAVIPGGPADRAGISRGHFITEVNGIEITMDNYKSVTSKIYVDPVNLTLNTVRWEGEYLDKAVITEVGSVDLYPENYTDPAIYKAETVTLSNGTKVGYLLYMGFHTAFDEQLIEVFDKFKADGVEDLVLDFRYNNGGEILSSTLMATMIAGQEHKGEILAKLTFNAQRTAAGEEASYRIGVPETKEYPDGYMLIEEGLRHSLDLDRVFVITSGYTASASEIIINGLRGLGLEVNLVGTKTSGKNVGMEGYSTSFRNYDFLLYPVTFYIENAKGFRDYPEGFEPDLYLDDSGYYPGGDFGSNEDFLCNAVYGWIRTGKNPRPSKSSVELRFESVPFMIDRKLGGSLVIYR